ncbi:MAG TPA: hypothetical protein VGN37_00085 [Actinocatenispora sp.]
MTTPMLAGQAGLAIPPTVLGPPVPGFVALAGTYAVRVGGSRRGG